MQNLRGASESWLEPIRAAGKISHAPGPFGLSAPGLSKALSFGDLDGDGDLDLFSGAQPGSLFYFENAGSATGPSFVARTGPPNPFDGMDLGDRSAPSASDLDRDGDLDIVIGRNDGTLAYLPEPARGLLLGAGIALLSLLDRWRHRRP